MTKDTSATKIDCPGCGEPIVVFKSGEVAEEREEPVPTGVIVSPMDSAFKAHWCDANDRQYVCHGCHRIWDEESTAEACCKWEAPDREYSLVSEYDGEHEFELVQ